MQPNRVLENIDYICRVDNIRVDIGFRTLNPE